MNARIYVEKVYIRIRKQGEYADKQTRMTYSRSQNIERISTFVKFRKWQQPCKRMVYPTHVML